MQGSRIFALSILAGFIAGGILAALQVTIVQSYMKFLVQDIIDELLADGEFDEELFDSQARLVYLGQTAGSAAMGLAAGVLIGGVRAYGRRKAGIGDAILIAAIAYFVLYAVPAAKYPPSPIAMFSEEAAADYYPLYFSYLALSGLAALGVAAVFTRVSRKNKLFGMAAAYLVIVAVAYAIFPPYELDSTFDESLLNSWRALVSAAMTASWFSAGAIAGLLWKYGSARMN
ncbi:MAG: CbtA family protein [Nitrososphaera sp.]